MPKQIILVSDDGQQQSIDINDDLYNTIAALSNTSDNSLNINGLLNDIFVLNKWDKFAKYESFITLLHNVLSKYITTNNITQCVSALQFISNKDNLNNAFLKKSKFNLMDIFKNNNLSFFNNKQLISDIIALSDRNIGNGEIFFTLFTKCYKGKVVDLFVIDKQNREYNQVEIKGPDGRIGTELQARNFLDEYKLSNKITSDTEAVKRIIKDLPTYSNKAKIDTIYGLRTEYSSINKEYFTMQIDAILNEFSDIQYDKLILATQIYSYCSSIRANYLVLLNKTDICNIKIDCLWGIYEQLLDTNLKIKFSISNRYGFGVTYIPNK